MRTYLNNPNLTTIKPNFAGNQMIDGKFVNIYQGQKRPHWKEILRWQFTPKLQRYKNKYTRYHPERITNHNLFDTTDDKIVWLGHASFLITLNGKNILLDPIFKKIPLVKRKVNIPFDYRQLGKIDYILISHAHYDHMDKFSLKFTCKKNPQAQIYCGLNNANTLRKWEINNAIIEAGWWQQYPINADNIEFNFLPAQHWSNRSLGDRNTRLWGSFLIKHKKQQIYFMGDSSYEGHFAEIGQHFPDIDYAIIGIGAYTPQTIMSSSHMNPQQAFQAFKDLQAKQFIPMHYGTFILADEPLDEPIRLTRQHLTQDNSSKLCELAIGEIKFLNSSS